MEDIKAFFRESSNEFTIYAVEQKFAVGRGADYFRSYKGKVNYIDSDKVIKKHISDIMYTICKHIPVLGDIIKKCFSLTSTLDILDIISLLSKLFTIHDHQAAGPEVVDPIIIQEGRILYKYVNQIISLHKNSFLRPAIIIILKDNDFDRAKKELSLCPHGTNVKFIRNSGDSEIVKVINCGVNHPDDFLDAFSLHCFSTCSNTRRNVLYNEEWAQNSLVRLYGPTILQIRTNILYQDKTLARVGINNLLSSLQKYNFCSAEEKQQIDFFKTILLLFRVFVNDGGANDILQAYELATSLNNELLLAQVNKCAFFLPNLSLDEKNGLLDSAYDVFVKNSMEDQAVYCRNNRLVRQFDTTGISIQDFQNLQKEAVYNVPGLVGMSHIMNNVGVAHLVSGFPDLAIDIFDKGLDYAYRPERCLQKVALLTNKAIANAYCYEKVDESQLRRILNIIFDNNELQNLPFISARYALNAVSLAFYKNRSLGNELMRIYNVEKLIHTGIKNNALGTQQLQLQLEVMNHKYGFQLKTDPFTKQRVVRCTSIRQQFIEKTGYVPFFFSTWF